MTSVATIKSVIPHRPPALLVDRVAEVEPGRRLVAQKAVTVAEACYRNLGENAPPERYAYPFALLLESWAQSAVLLVCWEKPDPDVLAGRVALLAGVRQARMAAPVYPGSVVVHECRVVRELGDSVITTGSSSVEGRPVLEVGQLTLTLRDAGLLAPEPTTDERS